MKTTMLWLIVAGAMLAFVPQMADPYMTPRLLIPALAAGVLLLMPSTRRSPLEIPALVFLLVVAIAAVRAQDWRYAVIGSYQFGMDSLIAVACYVTVLTAAARADVDARAAARAVAAASIPMSAYGIFQAFFKDPFLWGELHGGGRVSSTQGGPVFLGAVLALSVVCALQLAREGDRLGFAAIALALPCMWFTQARGAFLAAAVGSAFLIRWAWIAALPALLLMPKLFNSFVSDAARVQVWVTALRTWWENPVLGYGPGNFYLAFRKNAGWDLVDIVGSAQYVQAHAHNDWLHVLATAGLVGLAAYAWLVASAVREARRSDDKQLLLGLLAAFACASAFNPVPASAILIMAVVFGAATTRWDACFDYRRPAMAFIAIAIALGVGRLSIADLHYARAHQAADPATRAMEYQEAARLNPWEMFYSCRQVDSINGLIPYMELADRRPMALAGRQLAELAVARHPNDSYAHELLGKQILIAHMAGHRDAPPDLALEAFTRAQELAPTFEILMWRRRSTAIGLGDADAIAHADRDIADLRASLAVAGKF